MARLPSAALLLPLLFAAASAAAQSLDVAGKASGNRWKIPVEAEPRVGTRGLSLPVVNYTAPDGSLKLKRGIVAGMKVAPNATLGVGLFETLPKKKKSLDSTVNPMERKHRRSRKAAVGFSLSF